MRVGFGRGFEARNRRGLWWKLLWRPLMAPGCMGSFALLRMTGKIFLTLAQKLRSQGFDLGTWLKDEGALRW